VTVCFVSIHNRRFWKQKDKNIKNYENFKKMRNYKYRMWRTETAQPIRDDRYPYLPSKPIRDEIDYTTITRVAMYSKRSAVKTSECDSVAKIIKRSILNQGFSQRSQFIALRHTVWYLSCPCLESKPDSSFFQPPDFSLHSLSYNSSNTQVSK